MKTSLTPRLYLSLFLLLGGVTAHAQQLHYVVIGGFAQESHAQKFASYAGVKNIAASYDLCADAKLFYVYVLKTSDQRQAVDLANGLRMEGEFKESWVYEGRLEKDKESVVHVIAPADITAPATMTASTDRSSPMVATAVATGPAGPAAEDEAVNEEVDFHRYVVVDSATVKPIPLAAIGTSKMRGKLFKFVVTEADGRPVPATIHYVNQTLGREVASYPVNRYVDILPPLSVRQEPMTLVCGIFGYKEITQQVNFSTPQATPKIAQDEQGAWVVSYRLEPLTKGDVSVMHHVGFYRNAVVMSPLSKIELDQLVKMMSSNPAYKIKIHGHANDANGRRVTGLGESKNYFDMKGAVKIECSTKELSRMRAEAVLQYLADHGISKDRITVRAWGNQELLVPETGTNAKVNDRIEIEIMKG